MKKILILILSSTMLFSCREVIEFDLNESEEQILVVEGTITNELKEHTVKLSLSGKFYGEVALGKVEGAVVSISDGTTIFDLTEKEPGIYKTDVVQGIVGNTYTLTIDYDGKTYTSEAKMKFSPKIDALVIGPSIIPGREDEWYSILIFTVEPKGLGDHYRWNVYINGVSQSDTLGDYQFSNDDFVDGDTLKPFLLQPNLEAVIGDTIRVEQIAISKEAYDIYLASNLETVWRGGIFDAPPANVPSNISNGAIGLWEANGVESAETVITF